MLLTTGFGSAISLKGVFKDKFDLLNNKHVNWKTQRKDTQIANKDKYYRYKAKTFTQIYAVKRSKATVPVLMF